MAAILRPQGGDEARLPDRTEADLLVHRCEAGEQRIDEHRPAGWQHAHVMGEDIAGVPGNLRRIDGIVAFEVLSRRDDVLEAQDAVEAGEIEALPGCRDTEAAFEGSLRDAQPIGRRSASGRGVAPPRLWPK